MKQGAPPCLTIESAREFVRRRPNLDNVPFLVLRGKGETQRRALSAKGEITALFECRASQLFHMDKTSGMPMLQFNTLVTHYKPNSLTGRLMFSGCTSILSDVLCMPEQLKESQVSFLQSKRVHSIEKQLRDRRLAVERIGGGGGVVMSLWWRTMGSWGGTPEFPDWEGDESETQSHHQSLAEIER